MLQEHSSIKCKAVLPHKSADAHLFSIQVNRPGSLILQNVLKQSLPDVKEKLI